MATSSSDVATVAPQARAIAEPLALPAGGDCIFDDFL
jgi:hypothetical protein